ncbi:hypothetical protein pipiens_020011, partial [Culex pipiens pipiens]
FCSIPDIGQKKLYVVLLLIGMKFFAIICKHPHMPDSGSPPRYFYLHLPALVNTY